MRQARYRRVIRRGDIHLMDSRQLHGIVYKLTRDRDKADLTERQEWFFDQCVRELVKRREVTPPGWRCSCWMCLEDPASWLE